jgi:hypothetical protein
VSAYRLRADACCKQASCVVVTTPAQHRTRASTFKPAHASKRCNRTAVRRFCCAQTQSEVLFDL